MRGIRGFSLVELVVYMALLAVMGLLVARILHNTAREAERPAASLRVQQNLLAAQRTLLRDLEETRACTVRIYPNPGHPSEPPGLSLASPRTPRGPDGDRVVLRNGLPQWQKFIYYTLRADPRHPGSADLVRREGPLGFPPSTVPRSSPTLPSLAPRGRAESVVAHFLVMPGTEVPELKLKVDEGGGFRVRFQDARGDESVTDFLRHPLLAVRLASRETSPSTGRVTFMTCPVTVLPRN